MVVLRCTQRLLGRLKQVDNEPSVRSSTRLGDWYGNVVQMGRRHALILISERSRLPVLIPIRQASRLAAVLPDAVSQMLGAVGVPAADAEDERLRMSEMAYGRTKSRSLLGTLKRLLVWRAPALRRSATRLPGRHRAATGRNAHHAAGRRLSDRPDPRAVLSVNVGCPWTDCRRSDLRLFGSAWARQDFPSALRGLDPPSALPWSCHYRSDETA
jgi:hypothetical protein